jgi:hypothetical protein
LNITDLVVTNAAAEPVTATSDAAVHAVAFFGDATGNGAYSGLDAQRVARVGVGLDRGFAAYPNIDPVILSDITGNGQLSGLDAQRIALAAVGGAVPEIPAVAQPQRLAAIEAGSRSRQTSGNSAIGNQTPGWSDNQRLSLHPGIFSVAERWMPSVDAVFARSVSFTRTSSRERTPIATFLPPHQVGHGKARDLTAGQEDAETGRGDPLMHDAELFDAFFANWVGSV